MADQELLAAIETGELIIQVNDERSLYDPFRLSNQLETLMATRATAAKVANSMTLMAAGDKAGARERVTEAREKLADLLRSGFAYVKGLTAMDVPAADVSDALVSYGWEGGLMGDLKSPARIEALADQALAATPNLDPEVRYLAPLVTRIANWVGVLGANQVIAGGGSLQTLTDQKDAAKEALLVAISRVRFWYCSASDERDQTAELAKIGLQPRRDRGEAQPQPLPGTPGTATFDAATREISVPDLPANATSLRAWRQPAGGEAEMAGASVGPVVSVSGFSPLTPGVTYQVWVTGHNSRGDGPESNKVSFTA